MKFELAKSGNLLIVRVAGELDHHFADEIRMRIDAEIMKPPVTNILFDFNNLSFMDSSGIGMIMGRYKKIKALGGKAWIICNNPNATRILEMSGVFKYCLQMNSIACANERIPRRARKSAFPGIVHFAHCCTFLNGHSF